MALTNEKIHATADELHAQGINPTLAEVRKALGGGSFTTIGEAMKSWREGHQDEQQLQQVALPSGITDRLQSLGAEVWQTAIDMANDRLAKEREALEVIKAKAQAETDEAQEAVKTLESEQAGLLVQLDEVTATAETATEAVKKANTEWDTTKQMLIDTKHELALEQTKTKTAEKQLAASSSALDKASTGLTASSLKVVELETIAQSDKVEIERLKSELVDAKTKLDKVTTAHDKIEVASAEVKGKLTVTTAQRDELKKDLEVRTTERDELSVINNQLTNDKDRLTAEHGTLNKTYDELLANYLSEQEQVTALQANLEKVQGELAITQNKQDD